jgi:hypothetical protein
MYFFDCSRVPFPLFLREIDKSVLYVMIGFLLFFASAPADAERLALLRIHRYGSAVMLNDGNPTPRERRVSRDYLFSGHGILGVTAILLLTRWLVDHPSRGRVG